MKQGQANDSNQPVQQEILEPEFIAGGILDNLFQDIGD